MVGLDIQGHLLHGYALLCLGVVAAVVLGKVGWEWRKARRHL